ncbi:cbb3-type cytochrome oxidase assembly protein [Anaerobacillus sp. CMMVII]|uniref:cbb3-type cytochrome oxidase assembly protein n=1 Tax=Anaerobacillus sp. CMMVII TaxID=2755588 RepID=UPI0021B73A60|nr:cbb3-type cytochrome oxidase assembly protein [Anaerobacillus sp. CMMVII]
MSVFTFLHQFYFLQSLLGLSMNGWILIIIMTSLSGGAFFIYYGAKKTGQFEDVEGIKYRMLIEEEDEWEVFD